MPIGRGGGTRWGRGYAQKPKHDSELSTYLCLKTVLRNKNPKIKTKQ